MKYHARVLLALGLIVSLQTCFGQEEFLWLFGGNMLSTSLVQCQSYSIVVESRSSNTSEIGVPPYYLIAFKPNGIPTTSFIGTDPTNLTWQVNQPSGSTLLLSVTDSQKNMGGQPSALYTVTDGDASCLPKSPSVNITLAVNVTGSAETCQPIGYRVFGGQPPYTISLAAPGSPVVTNETLPKEDDVFTYINRADPNGQLMASVNDANGVWGVSTPLLKTEGPAVTTNSCIGLTSSFGNHTTVDQHPTTPKKSHAATIAIAVIIPVVVLGIAAVAGYLLWRRRRQQALQEPEPAFLPEAWQGPITQSDTTSHNRFGSVTDSKITRYREDAINGHGSSSLIALNALPPNQSTLDSGSASGGSSGVGGPVRTSSTTKGSRLQPNRPDALPSQNGRLPPGVSPEWVIQPEILIQHRDGGAVQEIPPPYIDRTASSEPSFDPNGPGSSMHS